MTDIGIFSATAREFSRIRPVDLAVERRGRGPTYRWEAGTFGTLRIFMIQTGMGPSNALAAGRSILRSFPLDAVLSTGFACALQPASIGDVIIGERVRPLGKPSVRPLPSDPTLLTIAHRIQGDSGLSTFNGTVVTTDRVICTAHEKRQIAGMAQAAALDMESAALATAAAEHSVPYLIIRVISDLVDDDLPMDFNRFRTPRETMMGLAFVIRHPHTIVSLHRLWHRTNLASARLRQFLHQFLDQIQRLPRSIEIPHAHPLGKERPIQCG